MAAFRRTTFSLIDAAISPSKIVYAGMAASKQMQQPGGQCHHRFLPALFHRSSGGSDLKHLLSSSREIPFLPAISFISKFT
jgi:hypothetical protein